VPFRTDTEFSCGPVPSQRLKELAASGELSPNDLVWKEGLAEWKPASTLKGLFPETSGPPPLPIEPPPALVLDETVGTQRSRQPDLFDKARALAEQAKAKAGAIQKGAQDKYAKTVAQVAERRQSPATEAVAAPVFTGEATPAPLPSATPGKMSKQRLGIAVSAGLGMLATFLPWVTMPIVGTITGTAGDGWLTLPLFIPALVLALRGDRSSKLLGPSRLGAVIPSGLAALVGAYKISSLNSYMSGVPQDNPFAKALAGTVQVGIGLYLLVAAGAAVAVVAWVVERSGERATS